MAKYIDSEKAIDACFNGWNNNAHDCAANIRNIPAADVVEVVRCKDCINHHESGTCDSWSKYGRIVTRDDAYCSYEVKRND